jgi:hypothetical protein
VTPGAQSGWGQSSPGANAPADTQQKIRQSLLKAITQVLRVTRVRTTRTRVLTERTKVLMEPTRGTYGTNQGSWNTGMGTSTPYTGRTYSSAGYGTGNISTYEEAEQQLSNTGTATSRI